MVTGTSSVAAPASSTPATSRSENDVFAGHVGTEDAADVTDLRRRIDTEAVPRLCRALDLAHLPVELLIRLDDARSARLS
ncbi:hypothetical protein [Actinomycetospora callitridis]|uniref:hypothetical protein n=1 Tax=Actinomycetospora callitridis TaxID=913944 RepID=UPI002366671D|nr:hypothetical protein [Actinomycetospora callitridis]MDD7919080.1 hypothetical protein [Actinomycetospora callitridis]